MNFKFEQSDVDNINSLIGDMLKLKNEQKEAFKRLANIAKIRDIIHKKRKEVDEKIKPLIQTVSFVKYCGTIDSNCDSEHEHTHTSDDTNDRVTDDNV